MIWSTWVKVCGRKAEPEDLAVGKHVYFRRGNLPEQGQVVGQGDELRVPLYRLNLNGSVSTRRVYKRNRSQLYVHRAGGS